MKKIFLFSLVMLGIMTSKSQIQVSYIDTFNYTGAPQLFIVPSGVDSVRIKAWGGEGGTSTYGGRGGLGGYAQGVIKVVVGDSLLIYVGGKGIDGISFVNDAEAPGGWNGGGKGGFDAHPQVVNGGAGGGASDVRMSGDQLVNRIIVAGAGGGGGGSNGGSGGGLSGGSSNNYITAIGGTGGTQVAGGLANITSRGATHGSLGFGGNGGTNVQAWGCGGGGGGYYGGGGGTSTADHGSGYSAGGGGGSSYIGGVSDESVQ